MHNTGTKYDNQSNHMQGKITKIWLVNEDGIFP